MSEKLRRDSHIITVFITQPTKAQLKVSAAHKAKSSCVVRSFLSSKNPQTKSFKCCIYLKIFSTGITKEWKTSGNAKESTGEHLITNEAENPREVDLRCKRMLFIVQHCS